MISPSDIDVKIEEVKKNIENVLTMYSDDEERVRVYNLLIAADSSLSMDDDSEDDDNDKIIRYDQLQKCIAANEVKYKDERNTNDQRNIMNDILCINSFHGEVRSKIQKNVNLIIVDLIEYILKNPARSDQAEERFRNLQKFIL